MSNKVNGFTAAGSFVGQSLDYITITSTVNFLAGQPAFDKVVEIVSQKAQPIILGAPVLDAGSYIVKMAVAAGVWAAADLEAAIFADQVSGMGFLSGNTTVAVAEF